MTRRARADVWGRFWAAIITGALAGLAGFAVGAWVGYDRAGGAAAAIGALAALLHWLAGDRSEPDRARADLVGSAAPVSPANLLTTTAALPPPADIIQTVRIDLIEENAGGARGQFIDLPATPDQLRALADGLADGLTLSLSTWTGSGKPFSRSQFEELRGELIRRGLARWNNPAAPAQGAAITPAGRAVLRHFATPSPTDTEGENGA